MKKLFFTLFFLGIIAIGSHYFFQYKNTQLVFSYLKPFPKSIETNSYQAAHPLTYFGESKIKRAVLFLHGFGSAPVAFETLSQKLKEKQIPYYAPLITGFGICDFHLLDVVTSSDWVRDALFAFDLVASFADEVDVVAHSNGGCLALILATKRPIHKLILLDPFLSSTAPWIVQKSLNWPFLKFAIPFLMPVAMKPHYAGRATYADVLNPQANVFEFSGAPLKSYEALGLTQQTAIQETRFVKEWIEKKKNPQESLFLLYGREDKTVNISGMLSYFTKGQIPVQMRSYPCTAHDILSDYRAQEVIGDILYILENNALNPATDTTNDHPSNCGNG